ncbi:hypothetical protein ACVGOW_23385 [Pseudonocardia saturnea]
MTAPGCGTHAGLGAELRAVAVLLLDRIGPVLDRARADGAAAAPSTSTCAVCPVCAVVALLRGERPELAVRLAEHAAGFLDVLQSAMDAAADPPPPPSAPPHPASARRVQRIHVERPAARC